MTPTQLHLWAIQYGIDPAAIRDLVRLMGAGYDLADTIPPNDDSEAAVQAGLRLAASKIGARLWRNNRGAGYMADGSFIRWGLANDSKTMNDRIKSHDLIGIKPVLIEPYHVGTVIGQFLSREAKPANWHYTGTQHEQAQLAWAQLITSLGGDAQFSNQGDQI